VRPKSKPLQKKRSTAIDAKTYGNFELEDGYSGSHRSKGGQWTLFV
jgi:hypothetical protein